MTEPTNIIQVDFQAPRKRKRTKAGAPVEPSPPAQPQPPAAERRTPAQSSPAAATKPDHFAVGQVWRRFGVERTLTEIVQPASAPAVHLTHTAFAKFDGDFPSGYDGVAGRTWEFIKTLYESPQYEFVREGARAQAPEGVQQYQLGVQGHPDTRTVVLHVGVPLRLDLELAFQLYNQLGAAIEHALLGLAVPVKGPPDPPPDEPEPPEPPRAA